MIEERRSEIITVEDFLGLLRERLKFVIAMTFFVTSFVFGATFFLTPQFTARTKFMPPNQQQNTAALMLQNLGGLGGAASLAAGLKNPLDQLVSIATSRTLLTRLDSEYDFRRRYQKETLEEALLSFREKSKVIAGKDGLITIEVEDVSPAEAARIANSYTKFFAQLLSELSLTEAQKKREFFENQVILAKNELQKLEGDLHAVQVSADEMKRNPGLIVGGIAQWKNQISALEAKKSGLLTYMTNDAPQLKQLNGEIQELQRQLKSSTGKVESVGDDKYLSVYRDYKLQEMIFEVLMRQFELAKVEEARGAGMIQVIDLAIPPERKTSPRRGLMVGLAAIASFSASCLFLVFSRYRSRSVPKSS